MRKQPLAIVTMCFNEPDFLPIWIKDDSHQVQPERLYVIDHGSTDASTFGLAPVNILRIPRSPLDENERCRFVSDFCNSLLRWDDAVIYTDVDEILVADPRAHPNLVAFAETAGEVETALGMHLAHYLPAEPGLVPMAPILRQRRWALGAGSMCKPNLIRRPVAWNPGFHHADAASRIGDLFLFHIAYCDMAIVRRRQAKRAGADRREGHGTHHGERDAFVAHIESWSTLPLIDPIDLGRDCPARAAFIGDLMLTSPNPGLVNAHVTAPGLWRIPDRFTAAF